MKHPDPPAPSTSPTGTNVLDLEQLRASYYDIVPDPSSAEQRVAFGTSGHRGTSLNGSFTETHIRAITQAIVEYRAQQGFTGPLYLGRDTHALSRPAEITALGVLAEAGVEVRIAEGDLPTPTPGVSHAILRWNREHPHAPADGIVITPSHNPPEDGGFKYNPPHGGPADTGVTKWIEQRANSLLTAQPASSLPDWDDAVKRPTVGRHDYVSQYVGDLPQVIDVGAIAASGLRIGVDPLGGASLAFMAAIADRLGIGLVITNDREDPAFSFMPPDHDGKIRMDCSSPWAMKNLLSLQHSFDLAVAMDPDADRHGIVSPSAGLLNPNHYLALAIHYLFRNRPGWPAAARVGKTLVSSQLIDRVAEQLGRTVYEVPVGFKWFVPGLASGDLGFGGEESAGASFLCFDGTPWSTDKDGLILSLLAAEMAAKQGDEPGVLLRELVAVLGLPAYRRVDRPISPAEKPRFAALGPDQFSGKLLGGEPIQSVLTRAPGNNEPIGGVKVSSGSAWFAARPSGTENIYKLYAESLSGTESHLDSVIHDAEALLGPLLANC